jgi:hypothetical protein
VNHVFNKKAVNLKIDTGSQMNIISKDILHKLPVNKQILKTSVEMTGSTETLIPIIGKCFLKYKKQNQKLFVQNTQDSDLGFTTQKREENADLFIQRQGCLRSLPHTA